MKLKNKKTGEIGYFCFANWDSPVLIIMDKNGVQLAKYNSLAELNEEWCDYEEKPKGYWFIDAYGNIVQNEITKHYGDEYIDMTAAYESQKQIGNHFETPEEAEKAVEKLKTWHKLMDYWGTEVLGWEIRDMPTGGNWQTVNVKFNVKTKKEPMELLDIVFGGEE